MGMIMGEWRQTATSSVLRTWRRGKEAAQTHLRSGIKVLKRTMGKWLQQSSVEALHTWYERMQDGLLAEQKEISNMWYDSSLTRLLY